MSLRTITSQACAECASHLEPSRRIPYLSMQLLATLSHIERAPQQAVAQSYAPPTRNAAGLSPRWARACISR
jgi:hypothetical protein